VQGAGKWCSEPAISAAQDARGFPGSWCFKQAVLSGLTAIYRVQALSEPSTSLTASVALCMDVLQCVHLHLQLLLSIVTLFSKALSITSAQAHVPNLSLLNADDQFLGTVCQENN
jgi:hypothetical protein